MAGGGTMPSALSMHGNGLGGGMPGTSLGVGGNSDVSLVEGGSSAMASAQEHHAARRY